MCLPNKPTLLYFITKSELGGAQSNVCDLIENLRKDYNIHLATGQLGVLTERVASWGIPVHIISNLNRDINVFSDTLAVKEIISLIFRIKPDIIHAHSSKAGLLARVAGWICRVPVIFTVHGWSFKFEKSQLRRRLALFMEKLMAPLAAKLICVSESERQLGLSNGISNREQMLTIRNGICSEVSLVANPCRQPLQLIMVARFQEPKDHLTLLKAIAQLSEYDIHLELVGSGANLESSKMLANSLGITQKVSFLGDRVDVANLLSQSQVFILSTLHEGLPISILEAMRAGLPVVATNVNGIPEEVEHGKTGLLVPPQNVEALADALLKLIKSPQLCKTMGEASRQKFLREFTVERMIGETKTVYEAIISKKSLKQQDIKLISSTKNVHSV
jgi:glycosyltransferase involved in cell wall biosynthesis